jgi:non-lysosomal glucosylceramidase
MYNTYDVHFYASFALVSLWPQLQLSLQRDFALAVMQKDTRTIRRLLGNGGRAPRKIAGAVPHDLGSPCEEPWTKVNVYNFQDVSRWKDLGPKFVLTVLRDYEVTQSKQFVATVFPTIAHVMSAVAKNDRDGDGLIENSGFPDQTYDIWSVSGPSAYTGGLWIAALAASLKMANVVEEAALMKSEEGSGLALGGVASEGLIALSAAVKATYTPMLEKAKEAYDEKLWNGTYFNYDASGDRNSDSVMSDQLAGQWYAGACELEPIVETHKAAQALRTVYHYNVCNYEKGRRGCVNGMKPASTKHPNGHVDNNCMQSREVWTGTTYGVAACMLQEFGTEFDRSKVENEKKKKSLVATRLAESSRGGGGGAVKAASSKKDGEGVSLWDAAFGTIRGMWVSGWNELGYWYATPEGWEASGNYRSLGYMRPLSVWAMQYAIEKNSLLEKRQQSVDEESSKTKE